MLLLHFLEGGAKETNNVLVTIRFNRARDALRLGDPLTRRGPRQASPKRLPGSGETS